MKITSFTINEGQMGLKEARMEGLGPVVLLAGSNGGGKTRLLQVLSELASRKMNSDEIERVESDIRQRIEAMNLQSDALELSKTESIKRQYEIDDLKNSIKTNRESIEGKQNDVIRSRQITTDNENKKPIVINYRIRDVILSDSRTVSCAEQRTAKNRITASFDLNGISEGLKAIHSMQDEYIWANSSAVNSSQEQRDQINSDLIRIKALRERQWVDSAFVCMKFS
jgi:energy-coupling factor transporter ATP-binding protein EcfA2